MTRIQNTAHDMLAYNLSNYSVAETCLAPYRFLSSTLFGTRFFRVEYCRNRIHNSGWGWRKRSYRANQNGALFRIPLIGAIAKLAAFIFSAFAFIPGMICGIAIKTCFPPNIKLEDEGSGQGRQQLFEQRTRNPQGNPPRNNANPNTRGMQNPKNSREAPPNPFIIRNNHRNDNVKSPYQRTVQSRINQQRKQEPIVPQKPEKIDFEPIVIAVNAQTPKEYLLSITSPETEWKAYPTYDRTKDLAANGIYEYLTRAEGNIIEIEAIQQDYLTDVISFELIQDPVIASDGNTYSRTPITEWLDTSPSSPITRKAMSANDLVPNPVIQALLDFVNGTSLDLESLFPEEVRNLESNIEEKEPLPFPNEMDAILESLSEHFFAAICAKDTIENIQNGFTYLSKEEAITLRQTLKNALTAIEAKYSAANLEGEQYQNLRVLKHNIEVYNTVLTNLLIEYHIQEYPELQLYTLTELCTEFYSSNSKDGRIASQLVKHLNSVKAIASNHLPYIQHVYGEDTGTELIKKLNQLHAKLWIALNP